jgi:hypothetical protein
MADLVIDADGHIMEQHKDLFDHIKGNFGEMNWHSSWPLFDADGWQRGLARKGKREDPDAEAGSASKMSMASIWPFSIRPRPWRSV